MLPEGAVCGLPGHSCGLQSLSRAGHTPPAPAKPAQVSDHSEKHLGRALGLAPREGASAVPSVHAGPSPGVFLCRPFSPGLDVGDQPAPR